MLQPKYVFKGHASPFNDIGGVTRHADGKVKRGSVPLEHVRNHLFLMWIYQVLILFVLFKNRTVNLDNFPVVFLNI